MTLGTLQGPRGQLPALLPGWLANRNSTVRNVVMLYSRPLNPSPLFPGSEFKLKTKSAPSSARREATYAWDLRQHYEPPCHLEGRKHTPRPGTTPSPRRPTRHTDRGKCSALRLSGQTLTTRERLRACTGRSVRAYILGWSETKGRERKEKNKKQKTKKIK